MHDLKITNGCLVFGDGSPREYAEIAIRQGRIVEIAATVSGEAKAIIDAQGHVVAPGFIDLHTHCLPGVNENYLQSGVTTVIGGNCGFSPLNPGEIAAKAANSCGPNLGMLIGHNTVRKEVMGNVDRSPSAAEMDGMRHLLKQAMEDGAIGFSSGLTYMPGNYSTEDEVAELAKVVAPYGGIYTTHMRNEAGGVFDSVRETAAIARTGGLPAHISHLKLSGCPQWGLSRKLLALIDDFVAQGIDLTQDQYPYTASCGRIFLIFPAWAQEGGAKEMLERLADRKIRQRLKSEIAQHLAEAYNGDGDRIVISDAPDPAIAGRSLADLTVRGGRRNQPEDLAETALEITERFPETAEVYCVMHAMSEEDVEEIMRHPRTSIASDAWSPRPAEARPHPRMFGTFPRVLGHYARERQLFSLEEAVRRMTSLPASRLKWKDRGVLREGAWADITVFDSQTILDRATFEEPKQYPVGIDYVLVNGQVVIEHGRYTGAKPGIFISGCANQPGV